MPHDLSYLYTAIGAALGYPITSDRREGIRAIVSAAEEADVTDPQLAYILATAWHETAHTFQPIGEYGGVEYKRRRYDVTGDNPSRARSMGNDEPGDGVLYAGRGYVQLTWKNNYEKAGNKIGVDLVNEPERALETDVAAAILVFGTIGGWFTGKKLGAYVNDTKTDYVGARRVVNGTDQAEKIASYAKSIETALRSDYAPSVLRYNDTKIEVAILQEMLGLKADLTFGANTFAAVKKFQKENGLTDDGIVGPKTWAALRAIRQE